LKAHFRKHRQRKPWDFCWKVAIEGVIVSIIPAVILVGLVNQSERGFTNEPLGKMLLLILVLAPVLETLLFQTLPIGVARLFKAGFKMQVLVSTIPFAAAHMLEGVTVGICAGLIGGFYLAFTYAHWIEKSAWKALWITTLSHFIRNSFCAVVLIITEAS
jgi:hypothetical protein